MTWTHRTPVATQLRHYLKTDRAVGVECVACGQRVPPSTEHECWTVVAVPDADGEIARLRAGLERIAAEDYRGNEPWSRAEARRILAGAPDPG